MSRTLIAALGLLALAAPAFAQAPAESLGGSPVPGVCLLSQQAILVNAKVGVAVSQRLQQLRTQAQAEVNTDRAPIDADLKVLQAKVPKMKPADLQKDQAVLQARYQVVQAKADQRTRQIEAARLKAIQRVEAESQAVISGIYKAHSCGLLLDRNAVLGGNMSGDLTAEVVKALDAKIASFTFDLEPLK
jgi:Skp family chaperone for outer membrane proteins